MKNDDVSPLPLVALSGSGGVRSANILALLLAISAVVAVAMGLRAWLLFGFSRGDAIMLATIVVSALLIWVFGRPAIWMGAPSGLHDERRIVSAAGFHGRAKDDKLPHAPRFFDRRILS